MDSNANEYAFKHTQSTGLFPTCSIILVRIDKVNAAFSWTRLIAVLDPSEIRAAGCRNSPS